MVYTYICYIWYIYIWYIWIVTIHTLMTRNTAQVCCLEPVGSCGCSICARWGQFTAASGFGPFGAR